MNEIYTIIITSIAGISTLLGNILLFIPIRYKNKLLSFSLGLSFIVMFLISIIELIPDALLLYLNKFNFFGLFISALFFLMFGVFIVKLCDKKINNDDMLYRVGVLSMLSLLVHNIPEGIICAMTSMSNIELGLKMTFIIMLHNIPEGICIALPIYYSTKSKFKAFVYTAISGLGEIVGALITILFLKRFITPLFLFAVLLITAGIMIYLSLNKILKTGVTYKEYYWLILGILFGIVVLIITM